MIPEHITAEDLARLQAAARDAVTHLRQAAYRIQATEDTAGADEMLDAADALADALARIA